MTVTVLRPGLLTTVQDLGRTGWQRFGVPVGGAMDPFALRVANALVGNDDGAAAMEITLQGPQLRFDEDALIAVCGADLSPAVDGAPLPQWRPVLVQRGSVLAFGRPRWGVRAYLAVAGGWDVPIVLGSRSTDRRAGLGGVEGRALREGDRLIAGIPAAPAQRLMAALSGRLGRRPLASVPWRVSPRAFPAYAAQPTVRALRGPEFDAFSPAAQAAFFARPFRVTPQSDRMGYRLAGPALALREPIELVSEGVSAGTVQVPPDGQPIVLLADRQTVGGYPRIACVATVDLPVLAQMPPGATVRFREVSLGEAQALLARREQLLRRLRAAIFRRLAEGAP
ncbi:5-oxoprolinase subunit C family protein [Calditerricola satsumensis]